MLPSFGKFPSALSGGLNPAINKSGQQAGTSLGSKITSFAGGVLKKGALGVGVAAGAVLGTALFKGFNRLNAIDQAKAKLTGLGNSTKQVDGIMANALASVKGTAFGLDEAATTAGSVVAAGIKPGKDLTGVLKTVADTATIAGTSMSDMGLIFGSVAARGKLQGDDLMQLQSRGIPVLAMLAKHYGITAKAASKMVSDGKVDFKNFAAAMHEGIGGAAQAGGKTFMGALANLKASLGRIGANLLAPLFAAAIKGMNKLMPVLGQVETFAATLGDKMGPALAKVGPALAPLGPVLAKVGQSFTKLGSGSAAKVLGFLANSVKYFGASVVSAAKTSAPATLGLVKALLPIAKKTLGVAILAIGVAFRALGAAIRILAPVSAALTRALTALIKVVQNPAFQIFAGIIGGVLLVAFGPLLAQIALFNAAMAVTIARTVVSNAVTKAEMVVRNAQAAVMGAVRAAQAAWLAVANAGIITTIRSTAATVASTVAQKAIAVATKAWAAAQWLINAAMSANPIGIVVALIVALVAVVVILWKKNDGFRKALITAWNAIKKAVGAVASWFTGHVLPALSKVWDGIKTGLSKMWAIVQPVLTLFGKVFKTALGQIKTVAGAVVGFVTQHWKMFAAIILLPLAPAIALVVAIVKNWGRIKAVTSTTFKVIKTVISVAVKVIKTVVGTQFRAIATVVSVVMKTIKAAVSKGIAFVKAYFHGIAAIVGFVKGIFGKIVGAVTGKIGEVVSTVKGLPGKIKNAFGDAGSILSGIGKSIIDGLVHGITGSLGAVESAAKSIADHIPGPIKKAMGIFSPSRVMRDIGGHVVGGLVLGLDQGNGDVAAASARMANALKVDPSTTLPGTSPGTGRAAAGFPSSLRLVVDGYEFNAYVDARADDRVDAADSMAGQSMRAGAFA